ncbi:hypothetical protein BGZ83_009472 [Gryganskiella cystojenkinii]|nr:hypothetical protein BGZ83_009472 [Gryganskiella cystojenkinii]
MPKEVTRADVHDSHDFKETFRQQNTTAVVAVEETLSAVSTEIPSTASRSAKPQPAIPTSPLSNERLEEALQEIATLKQQMGGQIEDIKRQVEILSSRGSAVHIERTQSALAPREGPPTPPPPPPMTPISSKRWFVPQSTAANSMQRVLDQLKTTPIQLKKTNSPFIK